MYGILFAIVFAETGFVVTPFLPGDSLLFAAGALCAQGRLSTPVTVGLLVLAAFTGNAVNYTIGRIVGPRVFTATDRSGLFHRLLNREHLQRAHAFFEEYGGKAIILGRFVPIVRTFVPFVAGAAADALAHLRALVNLIGAVAWVVHLRGRRPAVRQRAHREAELLARRDRHRRRLAPANGNRASQATNSPVPGPQDP